MGCGCSGSVQRQQRSRPQARERVADVQRTRRVGGRPGEAGYAWTGPQQPKTEKN